MAAERTVPADPATEPDPDRLAAALRRLAGFETLAAGDLHRLPDHGIAHAHYRIGDAMLRVPRWSQFGLAAARNLAYQAACFERAAPSGHTPGLRAQIAPSTALPMGALLVDAVDGVPLRLPRDLPAMAACLASVHALPLPPPAARDPLADHGDPVAGTMAFIEAQAGFVEPSGAGPDCRAAIAEELAWARGFAARCAGGAQPRSLALTDTHPGNFLIDRAGRGWFVDLEKALYGSPAVDLAHATLDTSTWWDRRIGVSLSRTQIRAFYRRYLDRLPAPDRLLPWLLPMRRLTWLRTTTWSCKWRVERRRRRGRADAPAVDPALDAHIEDRLARFVAPETIARGRAEWHGPDPLLLD